MECDVFLFCLWQKSKRCWPSIIDVLKKNYDVTMQLHCVFPDSIATLKKFYNNEKLVGGYCKKLDNIKGEFIFITAKDNNGDCQQKLRNIKTKLRSLSCYDRDYNFIHSSSSLEEFCRQLEIIRGFKWLVTYT